MQFVPGKIQVNKIYKKLYNLSKYGLSTAREEY